MYLRSPLLYETPINSSPRKKNNIKAYTVVAFGWPAFFLDPFFANILWHFCANLRWIFINMVMINFVTMWLWLMGLWMNIFHLDICVRLTEEWGWLCWQWSWIVENNLFWHFDLLLRAKRHRLLLTNLGWHLNIEMMTWHEDAIWWNDNVGT